MYAIALILLIAVVPGFLMRRKAPPPVVKPVATQGPAAAGTPATSPPALGVSSQADSMALPADSQRVVAPAVPEDTVVVRSALYRYALSTRGGRIVSSRFTRYESMNPADTNTAGARDTIEVLQPTTGLLATRLVVGGRTIDIGATVFTASVDSVVVTNAPVSVTFSGEAGGIGIVRTYTFAPDDYQIQVEGRYTGVGDAGATLLVDLGNGFRNTESNADENYREYGVVTKLNDTELTRFSSLEPASSRTLTGPFEWVALKSKYFVAGLFAYDSTGAGIVGNIGGVVAQVTDIVKNPTSARVTASITVPTSGIARWRIYLGPMEYDRLTAMGRDFDDVNPYGWPGFRTVIRPFAVAIRTLFVWLHSTLGMGYGMVIVTFGILVRILLWPLNQKAMRSMTAMQAIQPELTALQARHKDDPQRLQQEMLKLYKTNNVNPFGGCWPMLLPYPLLLAVFFVLANTIELRGEQFLWMPDLSRADPLYIIPIVMAISMFGLSKISTMGMPPNPQSRMMIYMMPVVMLVFLLNFASGLNLYYAVQNLASLPQQWLIMQQRQKLALARVAPVTVHTKPAANAKRSK